MKTIYIAILVCIAVIAIVFAIPVIPVPVQRNETYTENTTMQEPYTVIEKQQVSVPQVYALVQQEWEMDAANKQRVIIFKICDPSALADMCSCRNSDTHIGVSTLGRFPVICIADTGKIRVAWSVNESERSQVQPELDCPPHIGFTQDTQPTNANYYGHDKQAWEGELELSPNGAPYSLFTGEPYSFSDSAESRLWFIAQSRYLTTKYCYVLLAFGYDCDLISRMPPINMTVDYIYYTAETVDKEVTKYRDVPAMVQKQRAVIDYQKISVWQRLFSK